MNTSTSLSSSKPLLCVAGCLLLQCSTAEAFTGGSGGIFGGVFDFFLSILCFFTFGLLPFCGDDVPATPAPTISPMPTASPTTLSPTVSAMPTRVGFDITAQMELPASAATAFQAEINRWEQVIVGDLADESFADLSSRRLRDVFRSEGLQDDPDLDPCEIPLLVDDHYICVVQGDMDGENGVLGFASLLFVRSDDDRLPVVSYSKFDRDDVPLLLNSNGDFGKVVRHEFGHALGLVHTNRRPTCASDSDEASPEANRRFQELSQCDFPVLTNGNAGRPGCGHWDSLCFDGSGFPGGATELMVPFISNDPRLSEISIANLEDAGYEVDYSTADPFTVFGEGCRCGSNRDIATLSSERSSAVPPLSQSGLDAATAFGRRILGDASTVARTMSVPSNLELHPPSLEVYYMEGDTIYSVDVE